MYQTLSKFFSDNPLLNILFLVLALAGIVMSLVFYYKSKKEKLPTYSKRTFSVIQHQVIKSNNLDVKYNGSVVKNLSMSKFAFWNAGRETILGVDISKQDPLIIKSNDNVIIYGFEILVQ